MVKSIVQREEGGWWAKPWERRVWQNWISWKLTFSMTNFSFLRIRTHAMCTYVYMHIRRSQFSQINKWHIAEVIFNILRLIHFDCFLYSEPFLASFKFKVRNMCTNGARHNAKTSNGTKRPTVQCTGQNNLKTSYTFLS